MLASSVLYVLVTWPMFHYLSQHPHLINLVFVQIVLGCLLVMIMAPMPALLSELFPVQLRGTGMSLCYNLGVMIFGGFAGMTITWLIAITGNKLAICFYVIGGALLCVIATLSARFSLKLK
jgi:MHS family proline/betaine transporter-like MFS transporter